MVKTTRRSLLEPPPATSGASDDDLIAAYIVENPRHEGPDRAETIWGVPVWILVGHMRGESPAETAAAYELPMIAVEAALAYYRRRRELIDARLLINDAGFE